ncbi:MAG: hypothetical protein ABIR29_06615 [Chthoniobacterales bacterium]
MQQKAKLGEAEELLREGEKIYEQTLGDENLYLAFNLQEQVIVLFAKKDFESAEVKQNRALAIATRYLRPRTIWASAEKRKERQPTSRPKWGRRNGLF